MAVKEYDKTIPNQTEEKTGAQTIIDSDHRMTHMKGMFTTVVNELALANNGFLRIGMTIPADYEIHLKNSELWGVGVPFQFKFYVFPTFSHGTILTPKNHYVSLTAPSSIATVSKNPTGIVSSGNDLVILFGGGNGVGGSNSGGVYSPSAEWILHEGTYVLEIQNLTGGVAETQMSLTWYELQEN